MGTVDELVGVGAVDVADLIRAYIDAAKKYAELVDMRKVLDQTIARAHSRFGQRSRALVDAGFTSEEIAALTDEGAW